MSTKQPDFSEPAVSGVFETYSGSVRDRLLQVRALIFETAGEQDGVGRVQETLKRGQPAYLTPDTGSGSMVRIDAVKGEPGAFAVYFHCRTDLVETFRRLYPGRFTFEGNRALQLNADADLPEAELKHCIALALTYHNRRHALREQA